MSEKLCLMCKNNDGDKYDIEKNLTVCSSTLIKKFLQQFITLHHILPVNNLICKNCYDLINDLDFALNNCEKLKMKLVSLVDCADLNGHQKNNVYCQTDTFLNCDGIDNPAINVYEYNQLYYPCKQCNQTFVHECKFDNLSKEQTISESNKQDVGPLQDDNIESDTSMLTFGGNDIDVLNKRKHKKNKNCDFYACSICLKKLKSLFLLKKHIASHSNEKPFMCDICGQAYKRKSALNVHVGMHKGINPFECQYCKKTFTQQAGLQRHLPIHTGETPYQCDSCGKRFIHHTSYKIHKLTHTGEKVFKCTVCNMAFMSSSHLKRHSRIHTGEKRYQCPECERQFAERYNLMAHWKLHNRSKLNENKSGSYRCQVCDQMFTRQRQLERHMTKEHQMLVNLDREYIQTLFVENATTDNENRSNKNIK